MDISYDRFLIPALIALASSGVLLVFRAFLLRLLHRWSVRTATDLDDLVISVIRVPSLYWCIAVGLSFGLASSDLPERYLHRFNQAVYVLLILSITIAAANLAGRIFKDYIRKTEIPLSTTGLAYAIIKGTILTIGVLVTLSVLGVSIAPLLTALGVGGLAAALALQDTLANLFAGIHILLEKSIRVGDFIRLENGQEGYVTDITWRTVRVRMLPNNMVIIPNSKLSQSIVTNYYLPEKEMSLLIPVGVSYASDPDTVERILIEEAKKAAEDIQGLLTDAEPFVRFIPGFGDSSLDFTLICRVNEFVDQYLAQHEIRKRIFRRFREEGIEIPFPHRTVYLREDKHGRNKGV